MALHELDPDQVPRKRAEGTRSRRSIEVGVGPTCINYHHQLTTLKPCSKEIPCIQLNQSAFNLSTTTLCGPNTEQHGRTLGLLDFPLDQRGAAHSHSYVPTPKRFPSFSYH